MEPTYLRIGASLVSLVGLAAGLAAYVLWNGAPESWTDIVATETVVRRAANLKGGMAGEDWLSAVHPEDRPAVRKAWIDFCQVVLNLNEFVYVN